MANNVKAVLNEMMMMDAASKDAYAKQGGFWNKNPSSSSIRQSTAATLPTTTPPHAIFLKTASSLPRPGAR